MGTNLHYTPVLVEDDDLVSGRDRIKLVRNDDKRCILPQCIHSCGNTVFILGIKSAGRLIEKNNGRSFQECSGNRHALAFTTGEGTASFTNLSTPPHR